MSVVVLAAQGSNAVELTTIVDFLRRSGANVIVASTNTSTLLVKCGQEISVECDINFNDIQNKDYDMVVVVGGIPGANNIADYAPAVDFVKKHFNANKIVASLCASPGTVLAEACGIMKGRKGCGYPGFDSQIETTGGILLQDNVVIDGNLITSRAPGTSQIFAIALIKALLGDEKANQIKSFMMVQ